MLRRTYKKLRNKPFLCSLALMPLAFFTYVVFVEPMRMEVTRHDVYLPGLPADLDGTKVVQLTDLHRFLQFSNRQIKDAVRLANEQNPDIVVLTGDYISRRAYDINYCAEMLSKLKVKRGIFAVYGNHDHWTDAEVIRKKLESNGITVLSNANREVAPSLFVIGVDDITGGSPDVSQAWTGVDENAAQLVLTHTPTLITQISDKRCLILTGHTHGGQVVLPFLPIPRPTGMEGSPYVRGWYQDKNARMYVNRGIGIPFRFRARPEVAVFTLRSKENTPK